LKNLALTLVLSVIVIFFISCQYSQEDDNNAVIQKRDKNVVNLYKVDQLIENVRNKQEAEMTYVLYDNEGNRFVADITYDGEFIHVSRSLDRNFIEEYQCRDIEKQVVGHEKNYILRRCSRYGEVTLLTVRANK
jgi:hypothetical protein